MILLTLRRFRCIIVTKERGCKYLTEKVIEKVMTLAEASVRWGVPVTTLKSACLGQKGLAPRFSHEECRKSGRTWLVTVEGMNRLYAKEDEKNEI